MIMLMPIFVARFQRQTHAMLLMPRAFCARAGFDVRSLIPRQSSAHQACRYGAPLIAAAMTLRTRDAERATQPRDVQPRQRERRFIRHTLRAKCQQRAV